MSLRCKIKKAVYQVIFDPDIAVTASTSRDTLTVYGLHTVSMAWTSDPSVNCFDVIDNKFMTSLCHLNSIFKMTNT